MDKSNVKKKLKKVTPALMAGLIALTGATAYIHTSKNAQKSNNITPGKTSIKFENEQNAITLEKTYPMTHGFAEDHNTRWRHSS